METDDPEELRCRGSRTFSLLTLADLAIALQDQGDDHNYAKNVDFSQILDAQCLLIREKDHNYSTCSRTELRGRAKSSSVKRCSSEENLTSTSETSSRTSGFSFISKKSLSCEQVVVSPSVPIAQGSLSTNENNSLCVNKLCSSWPKQNSDFMTQSLSMKLGNFSLPLNLCCDHTYASDQQVTERDLEEVDYLKDHSYGVVDGKFSFNDPRKIQARKSRLEKSSVSNNDKKHVDFLLPKSTQQSLNSFDHNYTYRVNNANQLIGSVESLDMDLSESDTDSCEETEQEESKMYQRQMLNAKQDHAYSKSGILSF